MPEKFNTLTLKLGGEEQVKNIVLRGDENNPDVEIPLGFKRLSIVDTLSLPEKNKEIITTYITGQTFTKVDPVTKEAASFRQPPQPLPPLDGQVVVITESTANVISMLMMAQVCSEEFRYGVGEWAHILYVPKFARELIKVLSDFIAADLSDDTWLYEEASETDPLAASGETAPGSSTSQPESSEPIQSS